MSRRPRNANENQICSMIGPDNGSMTLTVARLLARGHRLIFPTLAPPGLEPSLPDTRPVLCSSQPNTTYLPTYLPAYCTACFLSTLDRLLCGQHASPPTEWACPLSRTLAWHCQTKGLLGVSDPKSQMRPNIPCSNCKSWSLECIFPSARRTCRRPAASTTAACHGAVRRTLFIGVIQKLENALADLTRSVGRDPKATAGVGSSRDQFVLFLSLWKEILTELRTMTSRVEDLTRGLNTRRKDDGCPSLVTTTPESTGFVPSVTISFPHLSAISSFIKDTTSLHLSTQQATICWQVFLDRVDPLVKILHRPTVERLLGRSLYEKDLLRDCEVVLLFTIFFSSIISISAHEVETIFSISKPTIVSTYHSAIHEALSRNGFLATEDLTTLQALVLFLDQSRMAGSPKQAWALTGLARRLSLVMTAEQPTRFEAEMHRRLWWQLWYLDHRAS